MGFPPSPLPAPTVVPAMSRFALALLLLAPGLAWGAEPSQPASAEAVEFFEKKVRPVLVEHCNRCHGEKKQQAELRLDTAEGLAKGSDGGPVVVPGDPDASKLIRSVRRDGDYAMPPNKALPAADVEALTAWVKSGAAFPRADTTRANPSKAATHWAFQPIADPAVPTTKADVGENPIDRFVQARLEAAGLSMAPPAARETLARRAYIDLIGLPPTLAQVEAFVNDTSPRAFEKLVDELLASPHYGERWGRYWLDVARYADSKGYVFNESRDYPYAYTYRDYVVKSLNADKPYDRFVTEQLAADRLDLGDDKSPLAAMGFLTLGRRFSNNPHDIIDDRIDVVTRGLMGLTAQCARCHDHKFDPVGIADYYSLYGIFAASQEPKELPLIAAAPTTPESAKFEAEVQAREKAQADFRVKRHAEIVAELLKPEVAEKYLAAAKGVQGKPPEAGPAAVREQQLRPAAFARFRKYLETPEAKRPALDGPDGPARVPLAEFDRLILRDDRDKLTDLQKKGVLQLTQTQSVATDYQAHGTMRREKPEAIIAAMYDLGQLPRAAVALLSVFAVLPAESIAFATLERLLPDLESIDNQLLALAQKGWIEYNEATAAFKCSPVIQEVVRWKNTDLFNDCGGLLNSLVKELDLEVIHLDNYQHSTQFARYAETVIGIWSRNDYDLGRLCQNIGKFYTDTGDLSKAMEAYQKMADVFSALFLENPDDPDFKNGLAIAECLLGITHSLLGNLAQALTFFEQYNQLEKKLYTAYPQNVSFKNGLAISY